MTLLLHIVSKCQKIINSEAYNKCHLMSKCRKQILVLRSGERAGHENGPHLQTCVFMTFFIYFGVTQCL